ncbi:MAG: hypothetical protein LC649_08410 [Bacteroidales bacterium]|nr:hypothetical protein [Bacteroidales bacterium]
MIIFKRPGLSALKIVMLLVIATASTREVCAQETRRSTAPAPSERIFLGGSFGLQFGTYAYLEFSPVVGYWLAPRISVAAGPSFKYYKDPYGSSDVWGWKGYTRFAIINDLSNIIPSALGISFYLHGEYESLSFRTSYLGIQSDAPRQQVNTVFAGAGMSQPLGSRGNINLTLLWVVDDGGYMIYNNPEYRIEFVFRFFAPRPARVESY